jgi:hypothetical protein
MKNTIINDETKPYLGMQVFMKRESCIYVINRISDKRIYMNAIGDDSNHFKNSRNTTKRFGSFVYFQEMLQLGKWAIIKS